MTSKREAATESERFWAKVMPTGFCWEWSAHKSKPGYGQFSLRGGGPPVSAHRYAYEALVGSIPEGMVIDHLCRNRGCVNPDHLEPVTPRSNVLRGFGISARFAARTHCDKGHVLNSETTKVRANGGRLCWECEKNWRQQVTQCPTCGETVTKGHKWQHKRRYHS